MRGRSTRAIAAFVIGLSTLAVPATAVARQQSPTIVVEDGVTQPVFGYGDAIRERVWVESNFDSDSDGVNDRIALDIMRPQATEQGLKVPVVMDASPYYSTLGRGNESERKQDTDGDGLLDRWPLFYDNYFVPRGYAVVLLDMVGTANSTGCPVTGGTEDNLSAKVAVDWLNGRASAYNAAGDVVTATWDNGKAGMIGKSYDGTLANATAATGVEGLTTIVPISAISSWYDYTRSSGIRTRNNDYAAGLSRTVTDEDRRDHCEPVRDQMSANDGDDHGDYTDFWAERDYNPHVGSVEASVFVVHGINDNNVKPDHFSKWWDGLAANDVPRKLWLTQTGHVDPFDFRREEWVGTLHRWFDYWLQGVPNGIMDEPIADVEREADVWATYESWPLPAADDTHIWLRPGDPNGAGGVGLTPAGGKPTTRSFQDNPNQNETTMVSDESILKPHRLAFLSEPLDQSLQFTGTPVVRLRGSADQTDTNLGAILVDYGTDTRVAHRFSGEGIRTLETEDCWGESSASDDPCYRQTEKRVVTDEREVVTKGILDGLNRYSYMDPEPLVHFEDYNFDFPLLPEDYVFKPGHRLGVIVVASYPSYGSVADQTEANIELSTKLSRVTLPIVGGHEAAERAGL
ncbi:MAG: Xaa-Pro dipeptidyl-peptidase [Actinomycetota bacterium]